MVDRQALKATMTSMSYDLSPYIKDKAAIAKMRVAGRKAAQVLEMITPFVQPGVTTNELDKRCHDYIVDTLGAIPAPLNYRGFPKSICTSINQVVCHGIPNDKPLKAGDILNIDVTVIVDGYHGDTSRMFEVGDEVSTLNKRLCRVAQACLYTGIKMVKPGQDLKVIGRTISDYAKKNHYSSVKDYCGHGIGSDFHEDGFQVLHYDHPGVPHTPLLPGLTFTIEPMINAGTFKVKILNDGWTVVTKDRKPSAQWEHTLLVTETGVDILTLREDETFSE